MSSQRGSRDLFCSAILSLAGLAVLFAAPRAARGQFDPEEENPYRAGLIAHYRGPDGLWHARLESRLSHVWHNDPPDRRLRPGPFTAQYSGRLWIRSPGVHRLRVFAAGTVRLKLADKSLLDAHAEQPEWLDAEPIDLPFGFHPLEIEYRRAGESARIALYWEGPQFGLEPIAARWLFHDAGQTPSADFERGERLVRALRCAACHQLPGEPDALRAAALDSLDGNLSRAWLVDWLAIGKDAGELAGRRMPHFDFARDEAEAIADALLAASQPAPREAEPSAAAKPARKRQGSKRTKGRKRKAAKGQDESPPPSAAAGAALFRSVGCLACHRVGELGSDGLFGGGDLSRVADKRPAGFFARWLADPASTNRDHRMPVFALDAHEPASLSLYLQTLHGPTKPAVTKTPARAGDGAPLVREARCAACHALPKSLAETAAKPIELRMSALAANDDSCLSQPDAARFRPGYQLNQDDRRAIRTFVAGISRVADPPVVRSGKHLLAEHNCLACHARDAASGLMGQLPAVAKADAALAELLPAMRPPALSDVGDKLHDEALAAALRTSEPPRRPWLRVRMPKFPVSPAEADSLVRYFVGHDRIPPRAEHPRPTTASRTALDAAGPRLVTADGFGCTSCHAIGAWTPKKVEPGAQGSELSNIGNRLRRAWFDRWVRNPARIVAKMEMPAVQHSIRGVLDDRLDDQLAAVWRALNRQDFTPPAPDALRVVRRGNLPDSDERAAALTDVIEVAGVPFAKPLVVGLPNRHNVLFDLATGRLAAWWTGDVARQNTRGKSWYWEAGQPQLLPLASPGEVASADLRRVRGSQTIAPVPDGQYITEFDTLEHVAAGLRVSYRLRFANVEKKLVRVEERFAPLAPAAGQGSGFRRRVRVLTAPTDGAWELLALAGEVELDSESRTATLAGPHGTVQLALAEGSSARMVQTSRGAVVVLHGPTPSCELEYRFEAVPDQFAPPPAIDRRVERAKLEVAPGFDAVRLPLSDQAMPTGLAWRGDGTLVVSSLEGRVWLGYDDDGDGLEDRLDPFSDELAAPYGVAAAGDAIDVISKYALLRLFDDDGDGRAERTELLASGWGHTRDYHDWVMGLPRDAEGNYYVSIPCEQDERSAEAARFRGQALKLVPREPTNDDPRRFKIHKVAAGLRFPQGIALSREGRLFVSDQQGNYNPFNELNHIVDGARYGFINSRERMRKGFDPPFETAAIQIPHPWTRSVNGICFLETPRAVREKLARDLFGPFEGHLVGCEYDTRRLVRMSLERVGESFQGAVYPLSREPAAGEETFEGPIACQVAPDGDLYIGNIRDSGWGAGTNTGSIVRMRFEGNPPPGIAAVRAEREGFVIEFTAPVDRELAAQADNYSISSFRRISTPAYGGDDKDRRVEAIRSVAVSDDAGSVTIELNEPREGFVYEFHLRNLSGGEFFPDEAYYTLRRRPQ